MQKRSKDSGSVAGKVRQAAIEVLTEARTRRNQASMSWKEIQTLLQAKIDAWEDGAFNIDPRVLLGVFLTKDSQVEVFVRLKKVITSRPKAKKQRRDAA